MTGKGEHLVLYRLASAEEDDGCETSINNIMNIVIVRVIITRYM
jgi:hypothetical protein